MSWLQANKGGGGLMAGVNACLSRTVATDGTAPYTLALLGRVKVEEAEFHGAKKETLCSVAKYILTHHDYNREEYSKAIRILARYHLAKLADRRKPLRAHCLIKEELAKPYERRCARCGRPNSSKKSLETGYGRVCRKKKSASSQVKTQNPLLTRSQNDFSCFEHEKEYNKE
jgi:hypothetical protein